MRVVHRILARFPAALLLPSASAGAASFAVTPSALTGDVAPGTGGATYTELWLSLTPETALSPAGRFLAFGAALSDGREGVFRASLATSVPALPPAALVGLGLALAAAARVALRRAP